MAKRTPTDTTVNDANTGTSTPPGADVPPTDTTITDPIATGANTGDGDLKSDDGDTVTRDTITDEEIAARERAAGEAAVAAALAQLGVESLDEALARVEHSRATDAAAEQRRTDFEAHLERIRSDAEVRDATPAPTWRTVAYTREHCHAAVGPLTREFFGGDWVTDPNEVAALRGCAQFEFIEITGPEHLESLQTELQTDVDRAKQLLHRVGYRVFRAGTVEHFIPQRLLAGE